MGEPKRHLSLIRWIGLACCTLCLSVVMIHAAAATPSVPTADAPELASLGPFAVGTTSVRADLGQSFDLTELAGRKEATPKPRALVLRFWYPSDAAAGPSSPAVTYERTLRIPGTNPVETSFPGIARLDAQPASDSEGTMPLVIVSHGFGGWDTVMTNLTENLASKGYVVVAIDHADFKQNRAQPDPLAFAHTVINRARDQRATLGLLTSNSTTVPAGISNLIDTSRVALIGYSMGGFGALATAGAPYDITSNAMNMLGVPEPVQAQMNEPLPESLKRSIKAMVLLAPWGAQPMFRSWEASALSQINVPTLVVGGDMDDISQFDDGIRWIYDGLTAADRYLLVYQAARHNIANNPIHHFAKSLHDQFQTLEYYSEPVWRVERINAINQHFVTAFLALTLQGDESMRPYLDVPTTESNDATWPLPLGQSAGQRVASTEETAYWRGFHRRWAVGLEMHHHKATGTGD